MGKHLSYILSIACPKCGSDGLRMILTPSTVVGPKIEVACVDCKQYEHPISVEQVCEMVSGLTEIIAEFADEVDPEGDVEAQLEVFTDKGSGLIIEKIEGHAPTVLDVDAEPHGGNDDEGK